ncbi:hypothetical protein [Photobacterium carnosum]|uniref:hypothetical protein n=1 Tax=Photobacterium carnosum TaxID=2023717 RepID=UPI001E61EC4B|nr:hypothetical protein [Photobacterium carnosum]
MASGLIFGAGNIAGIGGLKWSSSLCSVGGSNSFASGGKTSGSLQGELSPQSVALTIEVAPSNSKTKVAFSDCIFLFGTGRSPPRTKRL